MAGSRSRSRQPDSASRATSRSSRGRASSRPSTPPLYRLYSSGWIDDANHYHHKHEREHDEDEQANEFDSIDSPVQEKLSDRSSDHNQKEEYEESPVATSPVSSSQEGDLEKVAEAPLGRSTSSRSRKEDDPNLVTWDGPDDQANPKNWSLGHRWIATVIVSLFTFISPVSSSMLAPAIPAISKDLGVTVSVENELMVSIFVLAYAIGPLFFGPMSELYGRVPVIQLANLFYFVFNLAGGFAKTPSQMLAFRFFAGLGGSAPLAIGGGVLSDCWPPEQRGKAISAYSLAPLVGPAIGPIAAGFISEYTTWRWIFWSTCIADIVIQIVGFFFLQETYTPVLLYRKAKRLRKETGNDKLHTEYEGVDDQFFNKMRHALVRPFILIGTQPIIQVLALYLAYLYGLVYLVLTSFPTLWRDVYHESVSIGSLNYISLGLGYFLGAQITAPINDRIYRVLKKRNNDVGKPEFRAVVLLPGALLLPIGYFWYGWSAQAGVHWIVPNIGACIFSAGTIIGFQGIQSYIVDAYTRYAASGIAAISCLRSLAGFGFPLFAPNLFDALGYGWGNSVLGFIAIALGVPAPFILWFYGEKLRQKSQYAAG